MGFEIEVKTGEGTVWLRGDTSGGVEMCKMGEITDPKTKVTRTGLIAFKWFASIVQAFDRVARMRVSNSNASTLKELVDGIKAIREDIKLEMGILIK